jgi:hypothetical protein
MMNIKNHYKEIKRTFDGNILTIVEESKTHVKITKKVGVKTVEIQEHIPWFSPVGCPIDWKLPVQKAFGLTKQYKRQVSADELEDVDAKYPGDKS